jgi:hypothetical protein
MYDEPWTSCGYVSGLGCRERMVLPYAVLPESLWLDDFDDYTQEQKDEYLKRWPSDTWKAAIGCPFCGKVLLYARDDVAWDQKAIFVAGKYSADTKCFLVEFECARRDCRVPAKFHTVLGGEIPNETALLDKLCGGFFGGQCSVGHDLLPIPKEKYRLTRILDAIPSDA